jgi:putative ABC transport system permease protein
MMVGIGEGTLQKVIEDMEKLGGTGVIKIEFLEPKVSDDAANPSEKDILTREDLKAFKRASNFIEIVAPVISMYGEFYFERNRSRGQYLGITPNYTQIRDWPVEEGRFIIDSDVERCNMVCVLGSEIRAEIFKGVHPIGKRMRIGSEEYTVVGVMSERDFEAGRWMNHVILIPVSTIEKRLLKRDYLSRILVKAHATDLVPIVKRQIKRVLDGLKLHPEMFKIYSQEDVIRSVNKTTMLLYLSFGISAAIVLIVGGIGIMNLMLVSVTERTKEIGIRKAVGAKDLDILLQFLQEAVIMSMVGGLIGIILGLQGGEFFSSFIARYLHDDIRSIVSIKAIGLAAIFAFLVGVFFGLYPAIRAARLEPSKALSYE